jgi:hypothetical protein
VVPNRPLVSWFVVHARKSATNNHHEFRKQTGAMHVHHVLTFERVKVNGVAHNLAQHGHRELCCGVMQSYAPTCVSGMVLQM